MRKLLLMIMPLILVACDVHEWPEIPERVSFHLRLEYETDMTEWLHTYDDVNVLEQGYGETYDNTRDYGEIRYIVRAYPLSEKQRALSDYTQEFVFTKDIKYGYDHEVTLDLPAGDYSIMVWSDLRHSVADSYFYDAVSFSEVTLQGRHRGNEDYRDAFRGVDRITLISDYMERLPDTLEIAMERPLAKFEFVTNDVVEFVEKEAVRIASKADTDIPTKAIDIEDYKVTFYYVGFMPDAFSLFTDKPVDSSTGVFFESTLKRLNESEASVGFDYVIVNDKQSAVTLQIGISDQEGTQLSLTEPIEVPLKRDCHTIVTGMFLMSEASGGVTINPEFDGDHNLIFP